MGWPLPVGADYIPFLLIDHKPITGRSRAITSHAEAPTHGTDPKRNGQKDFIHDPAAGRKQQRHVAPEK